MFLQLRIDPSEYPPYRVPLWLLVQVGLASFMVQCIIGVACAYFWGLVYRLYSPETMRYFLFFEHVPLAAFLYSLCSSFMAAWFIFIPFAKRVACFMWGQLVLVPVAIVCSYIGVYTLDALGMSLCLSMITYMGLCSRYQAIYSPAPPREDSATQSKKKLPPIPRYGTPLSVLTTSAYAHRYHPKYTSTRHTGSLRPKPSPHPQTHHGVFMSFFSGKKPLWLVAWGGLFIFFFLNGVSWGVNRLLMQAKLPEICMVGVDWCFSMGWLLLSIPLMCALGLSAWHHSGWEGWSLLGLFLLVASLFAFVLTIEGLYTNLPLAWEAWRILIIRYAQ